MTGTSVDHVAAAIILFEESTRYKDFGKFRIAQAMAFREKLLTQINGDWPPAGKGHHPFAPVSVAGVLHLTSGALPVTSLASAIRRRLFHRLYQR